MSRRVAIVLFVVFLTGPAWAGGSRVATGDPMPIGRVSHDASPVGFTYTETPASFALPAAARRGHFWHKPVPRKPIARSAAR